MNEENIIFAFYYILMKQKKYFQFVILAFFGLISCNNKIEKNDITKLNGAVFGTTYHIKYLHKTNYQKAVDSLFNLMNKSLSTYIPSSDISRINKGDTTVIVDELFVEVFEKARKIYNETNGYFDPTIGKLIDAYGFGSGKQKSHLSSQEVISLMKEVGFDKVFLRDGKVYRKNDNIEFNVNALAKGFGLDVVGRFLENKGIQNYLIEIGGEIRARGKKHGKAWKVAIEKPNADGTRSIQKIIELHNESMATSGNYRKYKVNNKGEKIVHTVNPKTGLAAESNLLSVSVRMKGDCADVDAYATAFLAMGLEKTKKFLKSHPELKVVLLFNDRNNNLQEFTN